jgi:hypothetical protein
VRTEEWIGEVLRLDAFTTHLGKETLCVYAAPPVTTEKDTFRTSKARTIWATSSTSDAELREFLTPSEA